MPLYVYSCSDGHKTDEIRRVDNRHDPVTCPVCGNDSKLEVQVFELDPRLGVDPSFPTMADRWAKNRYLASKAKQ